jgi:hypothetical protein
MADFIDTVVTGAIIFFISWGLGNHISGHYSNGVAVIGIIIAAVWFFYLYLTSSGAESSFERYGRRLIEMFVAAAVASCLGLSGANQAVVIIGALISFFIVEVSL